MKHTLSLIIVLLIITISIPFVTSASEQSTDKLYLDPFYRATLSANTNYTYTLALNPSDGITTVKSAIINIKVFTTPTVNFQLWVNGRTCKNPLVTISTTFAGAGVFDISFDCTNIITNAGVYSVTLRSDKNGGAAYATSEITYNNNPPSITVSGTDYEIGEEAKVFTTLLVNGEAMNTGTCYAEIFYPNSTVFMPYSQMTFLEDGIYYKDFTIPNTVGVYPIEVRCSYITYESLYNATSVTLINGTSAGAVTATYLNDNSYYDLKESAGTFRAVGAIFNYTGINLSGLQTNTITIQFEGRRPIVGGDPASDIIQFLLYNYNTSTYDLIGNDFSYLAADTEKSYTLLSGAGNYVSSDGRAAIYILDSVNSPIDLKDTDMRIDLLTLDIDSFLANSTVTNIGGGSELNVKNYMQRINAALEGNFSDLRGVIGNQTVNLTVVTDQLNNITVTLAGINTNLSIIYDEIALINANISTQNLTAINQNLTDLIIAQTGKPIEFDSDIVFLLIYIILLIVSVYANSGGMYAATGMYGVIYGLLVIPAVGFWFGLVAMAVGGIFAVIGIRKMW